MMKIAPPVVLDSARVLAYAFVHDIEYRQTGALYVDGVLLEHVPRLAICANLGADLGPLLFHCDVDWTVLGVSGASTVQAVKERAEHNYPSSITQWVDIDTSVEDALKYYDEHVENGTCSFCGKRRFEFGACVEGKGALICKSCIDVYHAELRDSSPDPIT
jgi:hypothetical protein